MIRHHCPRCETSLPSMDQECSACGYLWRRTCSVCGTQSIPQASFCGGCGRGFSWHDRVRLKWRGLVGFANQRRLHGISSGLAFGTLLFVFAFGSMGMSTFKTVQPAWEKADPTPIAPVEVGRRILTTWNRLDDQENMERAVTKEDLVRLGNLLLENCSRALSPEQSTARPDLANSEKYLQEFSRVEEEAEVGEVRRSDAVVFLFRIMSDLFEIVPVEQTSYKYSDIPHYHYLNLPVETLETFGLKLSRNDWEFGGEDKVSMAWLSQVTKSLVKALDQRLKDKLFPTLEVQR